MNRNKHNKFKKKLPKYFLGSFFIQKGEMIMTQQVSFRIEGKFITNLAREKFYQEHDLSAAIKLLMSCLECDEITQEERLMLAFKILNGNAEIVGTYPDDDYGIREITSDENTFDIIDEIDKMAKTIKQLETEKQEYLQKFLFVLDNSDFAEYKLQELDRAYNEEYGRQLFPDMKSNYNNTALQAIDKYNRNNPVESYLTHMHNYRDDDYGWLEPNGTYHPVEWARHSEWAMNYLNEHYPFKDHAHVYWTVDSQGKRRHVVNEDCLIYTFHWALLHNPYQGVAYPQYDPTYGLTKAQKEFLYNYYIQRNMHKEANALYQDDKM